MRRTLTIVVFCVMTVNPPFVDAKDRSSMYLTIGTGDPRSLANFYLVDSLGRRSGFDPIMQAPLAEIPHAGGGGERIDSDIPGGPLGAESVIISARPVLPGSFSLVTFSTVSFAVSYSLDMDIRDTSGHREIGSPIFTEGFLLPATTRTYTIDYNPAPGSAVSVTKVVTFPIIRQDLQAAFQLDQIGEAEFVEHLDKILAEGEKAMAKKGDHDKDDDHENKKEAIAKLKEFIHQLQEAARVRPEEKHEAEQAKEHEQEPETKKRFVSDVALKVLTSDAETLMQQLSGSLKTQPKETDEEKGHDQK